MLFWALRDVIKEVKDLPELHGFIDFMTKIELLVKTETLKQVLYLIRLVKNSKRGLELLEHTISDLLTDYQSEIDYLILVEPIYHYIYERLERIAKEENDRREIREDKLPQVVKNSH